MERGGLRGIMAGNINIYILYILVIIIIVFISNQLLQYTRN